MSIITFILKDALRKDVIVKKNIVNDKLIIRPLSKPPMIIPENKVKVKDNELSSLINSKTGC